MFEWLNRHKKNIMTYTLYLVIPSFIFLYGYGECAKPQVVRWVAKVNGEELSEYEWQRWIDNLQRSFAQFGQEIERDELRAQALEAAITTLLTRQKAAEWGIGTSDTEVSSTIREMREFQDEQGNFNIQVYNYLLQMYNLHPIEFEEQQRETITRSKMRSFITQTMFPAKPEADRIKERENTKVRVEYLAFEPSRYVDEVTPAVEDMKKFFEENREEYRIPDQRRVAYASFHPSDFIADVTYTEQQIESFFENNSERYVIPDQVTVEYITYTPKEFAAQAQYTDEEIQQHYDANQASYQQPAKFKVRYIEQPLAELAEQQTVTDQEIQAYYERNLARFKHAEQAKARHILLKPTGELDAESEKALRDQLLDIRRRIAEGEMTFAEAAKQYSNDPGSAEKGGDLGYFGRGRMVPEFEEAAFSLPLGQMSEPVKSAFGFHLILVDDRKPEGVDPLEEVRDNIVKEIKNQKAVTEFNQRMSGIQSLDELQESYEIKETDWFARGEDIPGITNPGDRSVFSTFAFQTSPEKPIVTAGREYNINLYVIEYVDSMEARPMTLEEARDRVIQELREEKAKTVARQAAEADLAEIKSASLTLQDIAARRNMEVRTTNPFSRDASYVTGFGSRPTSLVATAFTLNEGEIGGPVESPNGQHLIRLAARIPEHTPELAQVRQQVIRDYMQNHSEDMARVAALTFTDSLYRDQKSLLVGAAAQAIRSGSTGLFANTEPAPIPEIGPMNRNVNLEIFQIPEIGDFSSPVEVRASNNPMNPQEQQPVEAFYVFELLEIKESYLPEFDEVRDKVEDNYKLKLAEEIAVREAGEALQEIQAALASSQPVSATQSIDLKKFEDPRSEKETGKGAIYRGPYTVSGNGFVTGVSGRAWPFVKTALALEPGKISGIVKNYREKFTKDNQRVQGEMTGAYILQVLDKIPPTPEDDSTPVSGVVQIENTLRSIAFQAWIDEASAEAKIQYNLDLIKPEDSDEKLSGDSASQQTAAAESSTE